MVASLVFLTLLVASTSVAASLQDTLDDVEDAIRELEDVRDDLERHRTSLEDEDVESVVGLIKHAKRTMRLTGCSLILSSTSGVEDLNKVMAGLRLIEPGVYDKIKKLPR